MAAKVPKWSVTDDCVGIDTGRVELAVKNHERGSFNFTFPVEYTYYTGVHSTKGRHLARRLAAALNAVEKHLAENEASINARGHPLGKSTSKRLP